METTKENADRNIHDEIVNNLQGLLEKNYDAEKGFTKAMQDAKSSNLKGFLQKQAAQRGRFANELTHELRNLNEQPKASGSATGTLHRAWIDIKAAVGGNTDESILEECIRGEKASWDEYSDSLKNVNFPQNIHSVVTKQAEEVKLTLGQVKTLEDIADNLG